MRWWFWPVWVLLGAAAQPSAAAPPARVPFCENGRWGYLDSTGAVVIRARFWAAGPFVAGRAAVRENGLYGYLDPQGSYALPPAYDYAGDFTASGRAVVWRQGRPQLIDRNGRPLTQPGAYQTLEWLPDAAGRPVCLLTGGHTRRRGVLSANGRVLADTLYDEVAYLGAGRLRLTRYEWRRERTNEQDTTTYPARVAEHLAVADRRGQLIMPFGRYSKIEAFSEGVAVATPLYKPEEAYPDAHLLDTLGRVMAVVPGRRYDLNAALQNGVLVAYRPGYGPYEREGHARPVVLNAHGREVWANPAFESVSQFVRGRAWAESHSNGWYLVDKAGHRLNARPWWGRVGASRLNEEGPAFQGGVEVVLLNRTQVQLINAAGRAVGPPRRLPMAGDLSSLTRRGSLVLLSGPNSMVGFWDLTTGRVVAPRFNGVGDGFQSGLLPVRLGQRLAYLNRAGRVVWQEPAGRPSPGRLNLDYQGRSAYLASAVAPARSNGWYEARNPARTLVPDYRRAGTLTLALDSVAQDTLLAGRFAGHRLFVRNETADTLRFDAQDSRLHLLVQARDSAGRWRDVEYYPNSFCGNSYHQLFLAPGQYWPLVAPAYAGSQRVRMRVCLTPQPHRPGAGPPPAVFYSNEFTGYLNPAQWWRRAPYESGGIMDPYRE